MRKPKFPISVGWRHPCILPFLACCDREVSYTVYRLVKLYALFGLEKKKRLGRWFQQLHQLTSLNPFHTPTGRQDQLHNILPALPRTSGLGHPKREERTAEGVLGQVGGEQQQPVRVDDQPWRGRQRRGPGRRRHEVSNMEEGGLLSMMGLGMGPACSLGSDLDRALVPALRSREEQKTFGALGVGVNAT